MSHGKISLYAWCAENNPNLMDEWEAAKNLPLTPETVSSKSAKKVWWKGECGHEWQAVVHSRTNGTGCPICNGKQILVGFNDLATTFPDIAATWHPTKNAPLTPQEVTRGYTRQKIWWQCAKGHEWQATVESRTRQNLGCPYCSGRYAIAGESDLFTKGPELAKEWDYEKNGNLTPDKVKIGTHQKVWWRCRKGHSYQASVHSRTNMSSGCPICTKGMQTSFPEKAIYYFCLKEFPDAVDNYRCDWLGNLESDIYIPSRNIAIEYDGQAWHRGKPSDEKKGTLCIEHGVHLLRIREPNCYALSDGSTQFELQSLNIKDLNPAIEFTLRFCGVEPLPKIDVEKERYEIYALTERLEKENSLAARCPQLLEEWCWEKNGTLTPETVSAFGNTKVWWRCAKGHEWEASVANRARLGRGCPVCAGKKVLPGENDLLALNPELASEWNYGRNEDILPENIRPGTHQKVWWKCKICGYEWQAEVKSRVIGNGCPHCAPAKRSKTKATPNAGKSLAEKYPQIAKDWHPEKNDGLTPFDVHPGSHRRFWWKGICGHEWDAAIADRVNGQKCPYCSGKRVLAGYNDLATKNPETASQWDYEKSGELIPSMVTPGSGKLVWWKCPICGHSYQKSVSQKVEYPKCPMCGKRKR